MRKARIKRSGRETVYHCVSQVVGGQPLLGETERKKLRELLWQQARFSGLEVITYCLMPDHFHVLVRVPADIVATDAELVERATRFYGRKTPYVQTLRQVIEKRGSLTAELRARLKAQMGDVSAFMKELKQRFSRWFNPTPNRSGTLWAERFKSVLVEDQPKALQAMAAYIDLNPVRAGLVGDPKDYAWCGYGEAEQGSLLARRGLAGFMEGRSWEEVATGYRQVLLVGSGPSGAAEKLALDPDQIRRELKREEAVALGQVLRLRVRYFNDGVALGSKEFVNEVFGEFRDRFGPRRKSGARPMRGVGALGELSTMRDLQLDVVG